MAPDHCFCGFRATVMGVSPVFHQVPDPAGRAPLAGRFPATGGNHSSSKLGPWTLFWRFETGDAEQPTPSFTSTDRSIAIQIDTVSQLVNSDARETDGPVVADASGISQCRLPFQWNWRFLPSEVPATTASG